MDLIYPLVLSLFLVLNILPIESAFTYSNINEFRGSVAWLRLCKPPGGGENSNIIGADRADKCSAGFWFKDPVKVGCACGHGVWVFAKSWCDRSAKVIVAYNGTCFPVDKEVRYIRSIGYTNGAFMPYQFQATVGFEYVQELPFGMQYTYSNPKYDQHLGAIFRTQEVESKNSKRCLEYESPVNRAFALKYYAEKTSYKQVDDCFKVAYEQNVYTYDEGFDLDEYFEMKEKSKDPNKPYLKSAQSANGTRCSLECPANGFAHTTPSPMTSTVPPDYFDPLIDDYYPVEHNHNKSVNASAKACDDKLKKYSLTNKTVTEITEQTKRMIMANVGNSLKGTLTPEVDIEDYKFFQMSRKIMETVCPNEEVPHSVVKGLLRMFRVAVKESLRFYPFSDNVNSEQTARITGNLERCLTGAHPFVFEYKNFTPTVGAESKEVTNSTDDQCPQTFQKISYSYHGGNNPNRTLQSGIPCELETDTKQLDLPVETAWKTVMFAHYYCARHFQANGSDYSTFYTKMEMFFNRWIQHRWYYPGPSLKAYEFAFQMFDLKKFALNLDRCVGASRSFSNYRKWIKRPVYVKNCGGSLFQEVEEEKKKSSSSGKKSKSGSEALDAIAPKLTEFGNTAYCLPYWHTPASNPGINYDPSKDVKEGDGCVTYKKDDWENDMTPSFNSDWTN